LFPRPPNWVIESFVQTSASLGHLLNIAAMRLEDGDLLIVATAHNPNRAIADYAKRWAIETLFGYFKSRGFCLEATHIQHPERLSKFIALLTLALCWAFFWALACSNQSPKT